MGLDSESRLTGNTIEVVVCCRDVDESETTICRDVGSGGGGSDQNGAISGGILSSLDFSLVPALDLVGVPRLGVVGIIGTRDTVVQQFKSSIFAEFGSEVIVDGVAVGVQGTSFSQESHRNLGSVCAPLTRENSQGMKESVKVSRIQLQSTKNVSLLAGRHLLTGF